MKGNKQTNKLLWKYAALGSQFFAAIVIGIFIGLKADEWLNTSMPLLVWILPLLFIIGMLIRIVIDTSKKE